MTATPWRQHDAVDLFAGAGGLDLAAAGAGLRTLGIEHDPSACATRRAAGLPTIEGDVRRFGPGTPMWPHVSRGVRVLLGGPPCQSYSMAGAGAGRRALDTVCGLVGALGRREHPDLGRFDDERTALVLEPLRWALARVDEAAPFELIVLEQVAPVLPVWGAYAEVLRAEGYSVATGILNAEEHGVPQTRRRAFLVAALDVPASLPAPTHRRYVKGASRAAGDPRLRPWVSMADALGWSRPDVALERDIGPRWVHATTGGRGLDAPAFTVRANGSGSHPTGTRWVVPDAMVNGSQSRAATRALDEPAGTLFLGGRTNAVDWLVGPWGITVGTQSNATVGAGSVDARTVAFGHDAASALIVPSGIDHADLPAAKRDGRVARVSIEQAAALQTFPLTYPWRGSRTRQYQQIGNAVPPRLGRAVLAHMWTRVDTSRSTD